MDNQPPYSQPPALPQTPANQAANEPPGGAPPQSKQPTTKETVQGCGCLLLIVLALGWLLKGCFFSGPASDSEGGTSGRKEISIANPGSWKDLDLATRKSLAEMKFRDAKQLESELESMLQKANQGSISVELAGEARSWKHGVDFILEEVAETGFKPGLETSGTSMASIHSALQSMKFAWERFERFLGSSTDSERQDHASAHARELNAMRQHLEYARQWMEKGEY